MHGYRNPNKSYFQNVGWIYLTYAWGTIVILSVIAGAFIDVPGGE